MSTYRAEVRKNHKSSETDEFVAVSLTRDDIRYIIDQVMTKGGDTLKIDIAARNPEKSWGEQFFLKLRIDAWTGEVLETSCRGPRD